MTCTGASLLPGAVAAGFTLTASSAWSVQSALRPATAAADAIHEIGLVLTVGATVIFLAVMTLLALALRRRANGTAPSRASGRRWIVGGGLVYGV